MEELMITVPYGDFVDGHKAMADLDTVRAIVSKERYCSEILCRILGVELEEDLNE